MKQEKISVKASFGFFLLMSIFLLLNKEAPGLIAAVVLHEISHLAALKMLKVKVRSIFLGFLGIRIEREESPSLSSELMINLAGPAANFVTALLSYPHSQKFSAINCAMGLFELCPLPSLDGGQALYDFLQQKTSLQKAQNICSKVEKGTLFAAIILGGGLFIKQKNPMLFLLALGLLLCSPQKE